MSIKVKLIKFDQASLKTQIVDKLMARAERGANKLAKQLRRNLSTPGPAPSKPGEYPHKQTGELAESVRVVKRNQYRVDVTVEAPHAKFVEAARPFMERTLREMQASLQREIERK